MVDDAERGKDSFMANRYTWSFSSGWESVLDTLGVTVLTIWKDFFSSPAVVGSGSDQAIR